MHPEIREYRPSDEERVVELALRAWTPVFESIGQLLGTEIFTRLHGDWRDYQSNAVRTTLADDRTRAWVAELEQGVSGFVTAKLDRERGLGEITMLAVDPEAQDRGIGGALTEFATDWLRRSGVAVAMVETGGDRGHTAARRVYEKAGYTALPVVRYFKAL
ncbi:MAG: GNAT family N-acetyltransferase [Solirubrobacterales bacterium]|nr:GNAT family N-acetyltransferase [Solirubrobacterales bacterium]